MLREGEEEDVLREGGGSKYVDVLRKGEERVEVC